MTRRSWARAGIIFGGLLALASPLLAQRNYIPPSRNQQAVWGNVPYDGKFVFVRMAYPWGGRQGAPWAHDYPVGEQNFLKILTAVSNITAHVDRTSSAVVMAVPGRRRSDVVAQHGEYSVLILQEAI